MATDPSLHEDISKLTEEIRGLSGRFSAKEVLAQKASDLAHTSRNLFIALGVVVLVVVLIGGAALWKVYDITSCQAQFNKATEERSDLLTVYTIRRDAAMEDLVRARGLPNDPDIIEARDNWLVANWLLKEARELNPVPQYVDYCSPIFGVGSPKVPPAKKPGPIPSSLLARSNTPLP